MKALKFVAWAGLGTFAVGAAITFFVWMAIINYDPGPQPTFGPEGTWLLIVPVDILGLLLMIVGGLIGRPRYFWLSSISLGLLHIIFALPPEWRFLIRSVREQGIKGLSNWTIFVGPGLAAIFLGIVIFTINKLISVINNQSRAKRQNR